jgi:hypothetical protein
MVEYSDLVHAYLPSGSSAFQSADIVIDAYLGARVFGLNSSVKADDFGVNWRTWTRNGRNLVGDNRYLAETVIDTLLTEKKWTGGDLALAYEWDDYLEVWINGAESILSGTTEFTTLGSKLVVKTEPSIKRGSLNAILSEIGWKVQLFDSGEVYRDANNALRQGVDNGRIGKIVVTYEYLAEVTKVDSARGTIDLKFWRYADPDAAAVGTVSTYEITDYATDDTFAVKDYVVITLRDGLYTGYPGSYWDNENNDDVVDFGERPNGGVWVDTNNDTIVNSEIKYDGVIGSSLILSIAKTEQVSVKSTGYTRGANAGSHVTLATLTSDATDKYIFDSFYRFGVGDTPNFDGNALLILDSNGRVIGFTGDVAGPAAYKYVYVEDIEIPTVTLGTPRVRASVYYALTGETKIIDLPVKYVSAAVGYAVTINSVDVPLKTGAVDTINTGGGYLVSQGTDKDKLLGWYYYTSTDDASTITLRSNRTAGGVYNAKVGSITTEFGTDTPYGVGAIAAGSGYARPNPIDAGFAAVGFGKIYTDSKTLFYYRGTKYTGYTTWPWNATTGGTGSALAVRGTDSIIDAIFVYRGEDIALALTTFAIIKAMPYDWYTTPGQIQYTVEGSTAAITNAGVYEVNDYQNPTYEIGDIVLVKQTSDGWEIDDYISANADLGDGKYLVDFAHPTYEYFTVPGAPVTSAIWTTTVPYLDEVAARRIDAGVTNVKAKTRPDEGDEVRIITGLNAMFVNEVRAVVITRYKEQVLADAADEFTDVVTSIKTITGASGTGADATTNVLQIPKTSGIAVGWVGPFTEAGAYWYSDSASVQNAGRNATYYTLGWAAAQAVVGYAPADLLNMVSGGYGPVKTFKDLFTPESTVTVVVQNVTAFDVDGRSVVDNDGDEIIKFEIVITSNVLAGTSTTLHAQISGLIISE